MDELHLISDLAKIHKVKAGRLITMCRVHGINVTGVDFPKISDRELPRLMKAVDIDKQVREARERKKNLDMQRSMVMKCARLMYRSVGDKMAAINKEIRTLKQKEI